jgi:hypothetical protein
MTTQKASYPSCQRAEQIQDVLLVSPADGKLTASLGADVVNTR